MVDLGKISIQDVFLKMQMIFMRSKSGFAFKKELFRSFVINVTILILSGAHQ